MKIVHVIPGKSIFEAGVQSTAKELEHELFIYAPKRHIGMSLRAFFSLYSTCKVKPQNLFIFHKVPHLVIFVLSFLIKDFRYALLYWGEDYYSTFLSEDYFEKHCISKSPILKAKYYRRPYSRYFDRIIQVAQSFLGFVVLKHAAGIISLCPKQFRILQIFYFRRFGTSLTTPQMWMRGYGSHVESHKLLRPRLRSEQSLTVLICHSATAAVAHQQTLELLRTYKELWNIKIHLRGFLSYSGGDDRDRDRLEKDLLSKADFAESVYFERSFLTLDEVDLRLQEVDIAVFSCLRDEGVSLLTKFVRGGGLVCFNRFSINYDFFKSFAPSKLLTHEQFLQCRLYDLKEMRNQLPIKPPRMLTFEELDKLSLVNGKLIFHTTMEFN